MHPILQKTFGGLSREYYFRQFVFGLIFPAITVFAFTHGTRHDPMPAQLVFTLIVNTLLYPYSRFVYESVVGFIVGDNVFWTNAILLIIVKLFSMMLCWSFAAFVAPVGLVYLYYYHTRRA